MFRWLRWFFPTDAQKVARFCAGRSEQPDEQFVAECELPSDPETVRIVLAVRRAVAAIGSVDPRFIRASDAYPEPLVILPFWDSIDWLAFVWELEKELGTRFDEAEVDEQVLASVPWVDGSVSVKQMAATVRRVLAARPGVGRSG
jgi:hypothetical protein